jgi:Asp-tRNA(Asn)/Glu-tRNA(Gln) amidotransferase A subunit family amidase
LTTHRDQLSQGLCRILDGGAEVDPVEYDRVRRRAALARSAVADLFGDADVILTPAVVGEAPLGLESTGDPRFARLWTLLGWPALSVPGMLGHTGLPIGVQLVGRPGADDVVLACGEWLGAVLG